MSRGVGCCMIMIRVRGMVGCGWNRDHRALGVAEAVVAHGTGDDPADADMVLCADDQECRSAGFGDQRGPRIAREELELPAGFGLDGVEDRRDCLAVNGIDLESRYRYRYLGHPKRPVERWRSTDRVYSLQCLAHGSCLYGRPRHGSACGLRQIYADHDFVHVQSSGSGSTSMILLF